MLSLSRQRCLNLIETTKSYFRVAFFATVFVALVGTFAGVAAGFAFATVAGLATTFAAAFAAGFFTSGTGVGAAEALAVGFAARVEALAGLGAASSSVCRSMTPSSCVLSSMLWRSRTRISSSCLVDVASSFSACERRSFASSSSSCNVLVRLDDVGCPALLA